MSEVVESEVLIDEFSQLPSITGKDVIELEEYARLPRIKTYESIRSFLEVARKCEEPRALFIVAEWGEGKTSIYEGLLKKPEVIKSDLVIPVPTKRLIITIKEHLDQFRDTASIGIRLFACLMETLRDVIENDLSQEQPFDKIKIRTKDDDKATVIFIRDALDSIFNAIDPESRVFIFLDEFEDILDEESDVQSFIIGGLVDIINGYPRILCQDPYAGRVHFLIAVTPPAYTKIKSLNNRFVEIGRLFGQRIREVQLEKLTRKDAYEYILGILKYCWKGKLPRIPLSRAGMLNTIYMATLGNPRAILNVIELLLTQAKIQSPVEGKIRVIDPELFVSALSGQKIQVYGGEINLIDRDVLNRLYIKIENKCKERGLNSHKCINLVELLMSDTSPIAEEEITGELGIQKEELHSYLSIIGSSFKELWGIEQPFVFFKKVLNEEEIRSDLESEKMVLLKALEFYRFEGESFKSELFVPYRKLNRLAFEDKAMYQNFINFFVEFCTEIRNEDIIRRTIDDIYEKANKSDELYIMFAPIVLNMFYPSPSIVFLDFIEDLDKRFEVGMKLIRNLTNFEQEFHRGILQLLQSNREGRVTLERKTERYGIKEVDLFQLRYSEIAQEYNVRVKILSLLRASEEEIRRKLDNIMNEMKLAGIPLLLVFSWNPLPAEIRGIFDSLLDGGIFHYINFPLSTLQCHQVIGYIIARDNNYKLREERWLARALRILDELKFEEEIKEFIERGVQQGYTIMPLQLDHLRPADIIDVLRTLLVTEGDVEERYAQIRELDTFRIYGKKFPVNPKDIASKERLEEVINDLIKNGFVERDNKVVKVKLTSPEKRLLLLLNNVFNGSVEEDLIDKFFIVVRSSSGSTYGTDIYRRVLIEKERLIYDKKAKVYRIKSLDDLRSEYEQLKGELKKKLNKFDNYPYGYLFSYKSGHKLTNVIILEEYINVLHNVIQKLEDLQYSGEDERWARKLKLLRLLFEHLKDNIEKYIDTWTKELDKKKVSNKEISKLEDALKSLEMKINNLNIFEKTIKISEMEQLNKKREAINEIINKKYSRDDVERVGREYLSRLQDERFKDLYDEPLRCPVFDVKIIELADKYSDMRDFMKKCWERIHHVSEIEEEIRKLKDHIDNHEIFSLKYDHEKTPISASLLEWIRRNIGGRRCGSGSRVC